MQPEQQPVPQPMPQPTAQPMPQPEPVAPQPMSQQSGVYGAPMQQPMVAAMPHQGSSGMAVASMVLGILSLVLFLIWFIALPLGILAIIFGIICHKKHKGGGVAMAGLVTGIIGTVISLGFIVFVVIAANKVSSDLDDAIDKANSNNSTFRIERN